MRRSPVFLLITLIIMPVVLLAIQRSDISDQYKWKPEHIYPSIEKWEADVKTLGADLDQLAEFKGRFAGPEAKTPVKSLIEFNKLSEEVEKKLDRVGSYVSYSHDVDLGNQDWSGREQTLMDLYTEYGQKLAWTEPEMLQIPRDTLLKWVNENPDLKPYRKQYEDMYALQEHTLSEPEERILALSGRITGTAGNVFEKLTDVDMRYDSIRDEKGNMVEVTDAGWTSWRVHQDRRVREDYFKSVWAQYDKYGNTFAELMAANINKDIFGVKTRKYKSTLDRAMSRSFIPEAVYTNLVATTRANTAPFHKYDAIRKRILGVDHYRHWDYYVSLVPEDETRYTFEQGVAKVKEALQPLGAEYIQKISFALDPKNGWVDPFASQGKRGGAYSGSAYGVHSFMLYNFDYTKGLTLDDVSTIAHEVGHAMHTQFSEKNQPFPTRDYATFNAEVASTTNETLMAMKLLDEARAAYKKANGKNRAAAKQRLLYLLEQNINGVRDTYYRQVMFATWEWEAHQMGEKGEPMTKDSFSELYSNLLKEWHGPAAEYEAISGITWAQVPHFYRGYYVYAYATSYAAAVALAKDIRAEAKGDAKHKGATAKYLNYLKSGSSQHPIELLKAAGVDMTTPAPIESLISYFSSLVDELDKLTAPPKKK
jgi:oligoendopeptidase F